jgi:hypothetical protein
MALEQFENLAFRYLKEVFLPSVVDLGPWVVSDAGVDRIDHRHPLGARVMDIEDEIVARIRAEKVRNKDAQLGDFQIKASRDGYLLINLKTKHTQLIRDEFDELHDMEQLFPGSLIGKH